MTGEPEVSGRNGGAVAGGVLVRPMTAADAVRALVIYQAGLDGGLASFETVAPSWEKFDAGKLPMHRHVAVDAASGEVIGWVAVSAVSSRPVYAGVVEHSVYVDPAYQGRGGGGDTAGCAGRLDGGGWDLDDPVGGVPGEHGEPGSARASGVPGDRGAGAHRLSSRPVAGHGADRAAQPGRGYGLIRNSGAGCR